jgi:hypothetical protein
MTNAKQLRDSHDFLFELQVKLGGKLCRIFAFDANHTCRTHGHMRIDVEVHHGGSVIFPRGATYCAVPRGVSIDGVEARELVMSLVAMKPGDTDSEYFEYYTPEQLEFAEAYGEEIGMVREFRFCDENGNVKGGR